MSQTRFFKKWNAIRNFKDRDEAIYPHIPRFMRMSYDIPRLRIMYLCSGILAAKDKGVDDHYPFSAVLHSCTALHWNRSAAAHAKADVLDSV